MAAFERLPLFPLGLVCFPDERLPLHIFEPRYREMVKGCIERNEPFGIVLTDEDRLARVGCLVRVVEVIDQQADGAFDVIVRGEDRFHIHRVHTEKLYLTGDGEVIAEPDVSVELPLRERVIAQHMRLLELAGRTIRPSLYDTEQEVSFTIAHNAGLSNVQKQELLELLTENLRLGYLSKHFEEFIPRVEQAEDIRRKIRSNGHFRDFPPETGKV